LHRLRHRAELVVVLGKELGAVGDTQLSKDRAVDERREVPPAAAERSSALTSTGSSNEMDRLRLAMRPMLPR